MGMEFFFYFKKTQRQPREDRRMKYTALQETDETCKLIRTVRRRQSNYFENGMNINKFETLGTTDTFHLKRSKRLKR